MEYIIYNIKVSLILTGLYLVYKLFMSRETFLRMNRIVLLAIIATSFILPHVANNITLFSSQSTEIRNLTYMLDELNVSSTNPETTTSTLLPYADSIILIIYTTVAAFFAIRLVVSFIQILTIVKKGERQTLSNGVELILKDTGMSPFSWLRYIVMSRDDYNTSKDEILTHEMAHIRYGHSMDLIAADIACYIQWYNPSMWLLRRELCAVHEYEADKAVLDSGINAKQYQILLIKKAAGARWDSIANSFNHSKLKYRITMMLRKESTGWAKAKVLFTLPIIVGAIIAFANISCSENNDLLENDNDQEQIGENKYAITIIEEPEKETSLIVEQMPTFPGGDMELRKYLAENIKYPMGAYKRNAQGRVFVSFVVDEKGDIVDVKVPRPMDEELDKEAMRVVSSMPRWSPGMQRGQAVRVAFTVPVNFVLQ